MSLTNPDRKAKANGLVNHVQNLQPSAQTKRRTKQE